MANTVQKYRQLLTEANSLRKRTWWKGTRTIISLAPPPAELGIPDLIGVAIQQKKQDIRIYSEEIDALRDFLNEHFPAKEETT